ncbi:MAG: hypothetical protein WC867_05070 [Candidatus Pacearchaeota archaeon]|jgi:hypothetical protein
MPYKDLNKRRECRRRWYKNNRDSELKYINNRKKSIKRWFEDYKSKLKCSKCSEDHPATLEFHHKKSKDKEFEVSKMVSEGFSIEKILNETNKCLVLCSNCHKKEHYSNKNL